jgi:hypothetical protein
MKKVTAVAGKAGTRMRDRSRSAKLKVLAIARASRNKIADSDDVNGPFRRDVNKSEQSDAGICNDA